jgi:hypothetical protein
VSALEPPGGQLPRPVPQQPAAQQPEPFLVTIGDIHVSRHWVVTASGTAPLAGAQWFFLDQSRTERRMPTWAIVLAIVFSFACLLGLLFLLVKEDVTVGWVQVSVRAGRLSHVTHVPVTSRMDVGRVAQQVQQAQVLTAQAG